MSETDEKLLSILGGGAATWIVAARMGWDTPRANRAFRRLEKDGIVSRSPRSSINNIIWTPTHPDALVSGSSTGGVGR